VQPLLEDHVFTALVAAHPQKRVENADERAFDADLVFMVATIPQPKSLFSGKVGRVSLILRGILVPLVGR
jgi:hypothetical protein